MSGDSHRVLTVRRDQTPSASGDARRALGHLGEQLAAEHLRRHGYALVAYNERTRHGEVDLIAYDGHTLAFVEVKSRRARSPAPELDNGRRPLASLGRRQRGRLRRAATAWLSDGTRARPRAGAIRFDAIGVIVDQRDRLLDLEHLEGAW